MPFFPLSAAEIRERMYDPAFPLNKEHARIIDEDSRKRPFADKASEFGHGMVEGVKAIGTTISNVPGEIAADPSLSRGAASLAEGFVRGNKDLWDLTKQAGRKISDTVTETVGGGGDEERVQNLYQRLLAKRAEMRQPGEKMLPDLNSYENLSETGSYFMDLSVLAPGVGWGAKGASIAAKAGRGAARLAEATGSGIKAAAALPRHAVQSAVERVVGPAAAEGAGRLANLGGIAAVPAAMLGAGPVTTGVAALKGAEVAGQVMEKGGQLAGRLINTPGASIAGKLKRLRADATAPEWMRVLADAAQRPVGAAALGAVTGAGGLLKGVAHGGAIGAGLGALTAETPDELGQAVGVGGAIGGGSHVAFSPLRWKHQKLAEHKIDIRQIFAEHVASGVSPDFMKLVPDALMIRAAEIHRKSEGQTMVRFTDAASFDAAHPDAAGSAGAFDRSKGLIEVVVGAKDRVRNPEETLLHEFFHGLAAHEIASKPAIKESIRQAINAAHPGDAERGTAILKLQYARRLARGGRDAAWLLTPEGQTRTAEMMDRLDAQSALQHGGDRDHWVHEEIFAERGAAEFLGKTLEPGWFAGRLDVLKKGLETFGVKFGKDGAVDSALFKGKFADAAFASPALRKLVRQYTKERGEFLTGITKSKGEVPGVPVTKEMMGKHPAMPIHVDPISGRRGNDVFTERPDGSIYVHPQRVVAKILAARKAATEAALAAHPLPVAALGDPDPMVRLRRTISGMILRTGKILPDWFYRLTSWSNESKANAKLLEAAIASGEVIHFYYHPVGGGRGSNYTESLSKGRGGLTFTERQGVVIAITISKAGEVDAGGRTFKTGGNVSVIVFDLTSAERTAYRLQAENKLGVWGGDVSAFIADLKTYFRNHALNLPGETGLGQAKLNDLNALAIGANVTHGDKNPRRAGLKGRDREGIVRAFRLDRIESVRPTGEVLGEAHYDKKVLNVSPATAVYHPATADSLPPPPPVPDTLGLGEETPSARYLRLRDAARQQHGMDSALWPDEVYEKVHDVSNRAPTQQAMRVEALRARLADLRAEYAPLVAVRDNPTSLVGSVDEGRMAEIRNEFRDINQQIDRLDTSAAPAAPDMRSSAAIVAGRSWWNAQQNSVHPTSRVPWERLTDGQRGEAIRRAFVEQASLQPAAADEAARRRPAADERGDAAGQAMQQVIDRRMAEGRTWWEATQAGFTPENRIPWDSLNVTQQQIAMNRASTPAVGANAAPIAPSPIIQRIIDRRMAEGRTWWEAQQAGLPLTSQVRWERLTEAQRVQAGNTAFRANRQRQDPIRTPTEPLWKWDQSGQGWLVNRADHPLLGMPRLAEVWKRFGEDPEFAAFERSTSTNPDDIARDLSKNGQRIDVEERGGGGNDSPNFGREREGDVLDIYRADDWVNSEQDSYVEDIRRGLIESDLAEPAGDRRYHDAEGDMVDRELLYDEASSQALDKAIAAYHNNPAVHWYDQMHGFEIHREPGESPNYSTHAPNGRSLGDYDSFDSAVEGANEYAASHFSARTPTEIKISNKTGSITIEDIGGSPHIDAMGSRKGGGGSLLYKVAFLWAANNGVTLRADSLTSINMRRRISNMLSVAVQVGHTDFSTPARSQGLDWKRGDHLHNIEQLAKAEMTYAYGEIPQLSELHFDFKKGTFKDNAGNAFDAAGIDALLTKWATEARASGDEVATGLATAKRAVITQSALHAMDGSRLGTGVSEFAQGVGLRSGDVAQNTGKVLYSPSTADDVSALSQLVRDNPDGFTVDLKGRPATKGYVVAPWKETERIITVDQFGDDALLDYLRTHEEKFNLGAYLGGWFDTANQQYKLDAVFPAATLHDAVKLAIWGDQDAVFDLQTFETILTKDETGKPKVPDGVPTSLEAILAARPRSPDLLNRFASRSVERVQRGMGATDTAAGQGGSPSPDKAVYSAATAQPVNEYLIDTPQVWRNRAREYARIPKTTDPITGGESVLRDQQTLHAAVRSAAKAKATGPAFRELVVQLLQAEGLFKETGAELRAELAKFSASHRTATPFDPYVRRAVGLVRADPATFAKEAADNHFPAAVQRAAALARAALPVLPDSVFQRLKRDADIIGTGSEGLVYHVPGSPFVYKHWILGPLSLAKMETSPATGRLALGLLNTSLVDLVSKIDRGSQLPGHLPTEILGVIDNGGLLTKTYHLPTAAQPSDVSRWVAQYGDKNTSESHWINEAVDRSVNDQPVSRDSHQNSYQLADARHPNFRLDSKGEVWATDVSTRPIDSAEVAKNPSLAKFAPKDESKIVYSPATIDRSAELGKNSDFAKIPRDFKARSALIAANGNKLVGGRPIAELYGKARRLLKGVLVDLRIDIPTFTRQNVYVVAVHEPRTGAGGPGNVIGYENIARVTKPTFVVGGAVARIRDGKSNKFPVATVHGEFDPRRTIPADIDSWTAVGMDPKEHAFFYDKKTDRPVIGGDEAISVGNTVFVKNPVYATAEQTKAFAYSPSTADLKKAFRSDEAMEVMLDAVNSGPSDGGCLICAKALQQVYGGEVIRIESQVEGKFQTEHYGLRMPDGRVADGNGIFRTAGHWVRGFEDLESFERPTRVREGVKVGETDVPDDPAAVKKLAQLLMKKLTDHKDSSYSPSTARPESKVVDAPGLSKKPAVVEDGVTLISTRTPTAVTAPDRSELLYLTREALAETGPLIHTLAKKLRHDNILTLQEKRRSSSSLVDAHIEAVKGNLRFLYDAYANYRDRAKKWYDGANVLARQFSEKHGFSVEQISAILASHSPQKDWYQNVDLARRNIELFREFEKTNPEFTSEIFDKLEVTTNIATAEWIKGIAKKIREAGGSAETIKLKQDEYVAKKAAELADHKVRSVGRRWHDLPIDGQARLLRMLDEIHNERSYPIVAPEGHLLGTALKPGEFTGRGKKRVQGEPTPRSITWGAYVTIENSLRILRNGDAQTISDALGEAHKIRNFYNNILAPNNWRPFVTIDTHAVGASQLQPFGASAREVKDSMGGAGGSKVSGLSGSYVTYAIAHAELAAELGIHARELQSITWEAVRGLFTPDAKRNKAFVASIKALWKDYQTGRVSIDETRKKILEAAGKDGGIRPPTWADQTSGLDLDEE